MMKIPKKSKLLNLPENTIKILSIEAARREISTKAFMESILVSVAEELEKTEPYVNFLPK